MKRKEVTRHQPSKTKRHKDEPEIISLRELHEQEKSLSLEELEKSRPHVAGEQSAAGSMPNPEIVTAKTALERAKKMGVYKKPK